MTKKLRTLAATALLMLPACGQEDPAAPPPRTASFTLRTMDHLRADVFVNGERYSETVCLWSLSLSDDFDPRIPVPEWPPKEARWAGSKTGRDQEGEVTSRIEILIEGGLHDDRGQERLKKDFPHLAPGEQVLYVKASIKGTERCGALRLKLAGADGSIYRYTDFTPILSEEDENAARFRNSVWFEREKG